mgnify:CR=1 FL=1
MFCGSCNGFIAAGVDGLKKLDKDCAPLLTTLEALDAALFTALPILEKTDCLGAGAGFGAGADGCLL